MTIAPPRPKGPPLNALRAFEAAARLGGFAAAAEELYVTPAAVAQQIKSLESWAGDQLFERRSQGVQLSSLGKVVFDDFREAFDRLGEATVALRHRAKPNVVHIAALPSVAQLWLSPLLPQLRSAIPGVTVSVTALETRPNLKREPFDIAVFYEDVPISSNSIELCRDAIYPVCAPELADGLKEPADVANSSFIHDATWAQDWSIWLASAAPQISLETSGPTFSLYALAVEEAKNGAGILIGHDALVNRLIKTGELVAPFKCRVRQQRALTVQLADRSNPGMVLDTVVSELSSIL